MEQDLKKKHKTHAQRRQDYTMLERQSLQMMQGKSYTATYLKNKIRSFFNTIDKK